MLSFVQSVLRRHPLLYDKELILVRFNELEFVFNQLAVKMMQDLKQNDDFTILKDDGYLINKWTADWTNGFMKDGFTRPCDVCGRSISPFYDDHGICIRKEQQSNDP